VVITVWDKPAARASAVWRKSVGYILMITALLIGRPAAAIDSSRDWRIWPFSKNSPWNTPIGSGARYAAVPGLSSIPAGLNYDDRWTSAVVISTDADPLIEVLVNTSWPMSNWKLLASGKPNCGNTMQDEAAVMDYVRASRDRFQANPWSTLSPTEKNWVLPTLYHEAIRDFPAKVRLKSGSCPSPDTDGLMADFQPNGFVLDTYATIVLANGNIVSGGVASLIDARGDGTGWWNGRRASMLPSFAGLIRKGEIAAGRIPHAMAMVMSSRMLVRRAVWPAFAFDRNSDTYAGTLPMGALLAIPAGVNINESGLTTTGKLLARAAQDYGVYVVDSTNSPGATLLAELNDPEIRWPGWHNDVAILVHQLQQVVNNTAATPGGGGIPRAPLAPDFAD
jgi:hypothetical protein